MVTYTGLEASQRRVDQRFADDAEHKKFLEDEVKEAIPIVCDVELTNQPDWKNSASPLVAEYTLKVPGWVSGAGRRALLPVGLFSAPEKHLFDHAESRTSDLFRIPVPTVGRYHHRSAFGLANLQRARTAEARRQAITYKLEAKNEKGALHLNRVLNVDLCCFRRINYDTLRKVFQIVRTVDEQQVALSPGTSTGGN